MTRERPGSVALGHAPSTETKGLTGAKRRSLPDKKCPSALLTICNSQVHRGRDGRKEVPDSRDWWTRANEEVGVEDYEMGTKKDETGVFVRTIRSGVPET